MGQNKGLASNPFQSKTPQQINKILRDKGFEPKGKNPVEGEGCYLHPKTGRKYYLDKGENYRKGQENPHVDVHNIDGSNDDKKKYPLRDKLYE